MGYEYAHFLIEPKSNKQIVIIFCKNIKLLQIFQLEVKIQIFFTDILSQVSFMKINQNDNALMTFISSENHY